MKRAVILICMLSLAIAQAATSKQQFLLSMIPSGIDVSQLTPDQMEAFKGHLASLKRLHQNGQLLTAGHTTDPAHVVGIVVVEAANAAEAEKLVADDPAVRAGFLKVTVQPFELVLPPGAAGCSAAADR